MKALVYHLSTVHIRQDVRVFYKECVSLAISGYRTHLIVADGQGDQIKDGVVIHDLGKPNSRLQRILLSPLKLYFMAIEAKADIYHFHDPELLPVGLLLSVFTKARVIYDAHESYPDKMLHKDYLPLRLRKIFSAGMRLLENFVAKRMDAVVTVVESHQMRFQKLNKRVALIRNYPLLSEWRDILMQDTPREEKSLCYVGSITKARGINVLLDAISNLDVTLHLAGSFDPDSYHEELISIPGWKKVIYHGFLGRAEATRLMGSCQIGVMLLQPEPNYINSLATKFFEYLAAGCAVLVSNFDVYRSLVESTKCGLCVNPLDPDEVKNAIKTMLNPDTQLVEMGKRGKQLIQERFNWHTEEQDLIELYEELTKDFT
jgi:glycosyltransferase involved in cell wall biosynthesis